MSEPTLSQRAQRRQAEGAEKMRDLFQQPEEASQTKVLRIKLSEQSWREMEEVRQAAAHKLAPEQGLSLDLLASAGLEHWLEHNWRQLGEIP